MTATATELTAKDYKSEVKPIWCPGCGDYAVLNAVTAAFAELKFDPDNTVVVSGIGCSSRFPFFVNAYGIHTAHGRALPVAIGVKVANPHLNVVVVGGDGDGFSIGGGHVPHTARKNIDITYIMMDNRIYGVTKGQLSPTSSTGFVTNTSPYGAIEEPIDPMQYIIGYGASFVARSFSGNLPELKALVTAAIKHKGFSFLDIMSPCVTFNKVDTFESFKEIVAPIPEGHDPSDRLKAMELAMKGTSKLYTGLYYQDSRPNYTDLLKEVKLRAKTKEGYNIEDVIDTFKP